MSASTLRYEEKPTPLSNAFFSDRNVEIINRAVVADVYRFTDILIVEQDEQDILMVMKAIYMDKPELQGTDIRDKLRELDILVINSIVKDIVPTIKLHNNYLERVSGKTPLMEHPVFDSKKGEDVIRGRYNY